MNYDSFIDYCFFSYVNIMLIVFLCQWNYMGLTFPGLGYCCYIPIEIHMQREALTNVLYVAIMGHADPWIFSAFQHPIE